MSDEHPDYDRRACKRPVGNRHDWALIRAHKCYACEVERLTTEVKSWEDAANMMADERDALIAEVSELKTELEQWKDSVDPGVDSVADRTRKIQCSLDEQQCEQPHCQPNCKYSSEIEPVSGRQERCRNEFHNLTGIYARYQPDNCPDCGDDWKLTPPDDSRQEHTHLMSCWCNPTQLEDGSLTHYHRDGDPNDEPLFGDPGFPKVNK